MHPLAETPGAVNTLDRDSWIAVLPEKTVVSGKHFPKSTPVSAQAVALGGYPLKRRTGMAGEEGDGRGGNRRVDISEAAQAPGEG